MKTKEVIIPAYDKDITGEARIEMSTQCLECSHLHNNMTTCKAFLKGIPIKILVGRFDHTKPFRGDNGIQFEQRIVKIASAIEPIDPPEQAIVLQQYGTERMSEKLAIEISQKLRKTYAKYLIVRNFGEMENAVLDYEAARTLALVNKRIVGVIAYRYNEVFKAIEIDHIGTLMSPKGTGAELVRTAVSAAVKAGVGMRLESIPKAEEFWVRLGFERNKKVPYVFEVDFKRMRQIKEALGSTGRVKDKKVGVAQCA